MSGYRYVVWCHDCWGIDPEGCFDGGTHTSEGDAMWRWQVVDDRGAFVAVPDAADEPSEGERSEG